MRAIHCVLRVKTRHLARGGRLTAEYVRARRLGRGLERARTVWRGNGADHDCLVDQSDRRVSVEDARARDSRLSTRESVAVKVRLHISGKAAGKQRTPPNQLPRAFSCFNTYYM